MESVGQPVCEICACPCPMLGTPKQAVAKQICRIAQQTAG